MTFEHDPTTPPAKGQQKLMKMLSKASLKNLHMQIPETLHSFVRIIAAKNKKTMRDVVIPILQKAKEEYERENSDKQ